MIELHDRQGALAQGRLSACTARHARLAADGGSEREQGRRSLRNYSARERNRSVRLAPPVAIGNVQSFLRLVCMKRWLGSLAVAYGVSGHLHAQPSWVQWFLQNNDSGYTAIERQALARYPNGDPIMVSAMGQSPLYARHRFVRCTAAGLPVAQWDIVDTAQLKIRKIIPLADGSLACFGTRLGGGTRGVYLHLDPAGAVLQATSYQFGALICDFFDAVQTPTGFLIVGGTGAPSSGLRLWIAPDGTVQSASRLSLGSNNAVDWLNSVVRRAAGGYVAACGSNAVDTALVKVVAWDDAGTVQWARTVSGTSDIQSYASVLELPDGGLRVVCRYQTPVVHGTHMVALDPDGNHLWSRRRVPSGSYDDLTIVAPHAVLSNDSLIVVFGRETGSDLEFVHVLDTEAGEVNLAFVAGTGTVGDFRDAIPADDGFVDFLGVGPGPYTLPSGRALLSLMHCNAALDLCAPVHQSTVLQDLTPDIDTSWSAAPIALTLSDFSGALTHQAATAAIASICFSTGAEEPYGVALELHPNPVAGMLHVRAGADVRVLGLRMHDMSGRLVLERTGPLPDAMDLHTLAPGAYSLELHTDRGNVVRRVVKE